jgi:hypothetical protein
MAVATAFAIGSLALGAYGAFKQSKAEKKAGEASRAAAESGAQLSDFNAAVADIQAKDAVERGIDEASRFRQGVRTLVGSQRAGLAAQGVDVGFGSAADVQADAAFLGELDALTIETNAKREAWGFTVEAADARKRAEIQRREGVMLEAAGRSRANAALIGGGANLLSGSANLLAARYGW